MKTTLIAIQLAFALLVAPAFAGNAKDYTYLALGDSIPFGMNALLLPPYATQTPTPDQFIGYPEIVAAAEHLLQSKKEVNASCPGETSGSFLDVNSEDLGCNWPHYQPPAPTIPPFKTPCGLHTCYTGAQMDFAESQLKTNKHINLVTLSIGANDLLMALQGKTPCDDACVGNALQTYAGNLAQILSRIRAHYQGTLIMTKYYSPAPDLDPIAVLVNGVMKSQVAAQLAACSRTLLPYSLRTGLRRLRPLAMMRARRGSSSACLLRLLRHRVTYIPRRWDNICLPPR